MNDILKLHFNKKKDGPYFLIQSECVTIDDLTLTDFVDIHYHGSFFYRIAKDEIGYFLNFELIGMLKKLLNSELVLDDSIQKPLGFYDALYDQKPQRKDLKYYKQKNGNIRWVGKRYNIFDSMYCYRQTSWFYNDKNSNIFFELSPMYIWHNAIPYKGETFVKFSQWLKEFRPYVVRKISREVVQQWVQQLEELLEIVKKNDERLSCTGPGCKLCEQEASQLCKKCCACQKCEDFHKEA